jgi:segregation and condensation protein A
MSDVIALVPEPPDPTRLALQLDGFEGPLDLLLDLARAQKVDLARISILALVEQYLAIVDGARKIRLEVAADWLVMAAWLTWLKSRLLLPDDPDAMEEGEEAAESLAARLQALASIRAAAAWLNARPQLGQDVFARGVTEILTEIDRSTLAANVPGLVRAYLAAIRRGSAGHAYTPRAAPLWSVQDALGRLGALIGKMPDWSVLERFLPDATTDPVARRAAVASTLLAGLELARDGQLRIRQDHPFGPIMLAGGAGPA